MKKKFRAFNTNDGKMWSAQDLLDNGYIFTFDGEVRFESFCGAQGDVCDEFIVLQLTGLKDKNGVESYPDDIIKITILDGLEQDDHGEYALNDDGGLIDKHREEIVYIDYDENNYYELTAFYNNGKKWDNGRSYEDWDDRFYATEDYGDIKSWEIIGNIYQSPDLLQGDSNG